MAPGIDEAGRAHKIQVIPEALDRHRPDRADAVDVPAKVGGLEIAGLAGPILVRQGTSAGGAGLGSRRRSRVVAVGIQPLAATT